MRDEVDMTCRADMELVGLPGVAALSLIGKQFSTPAQGVELLATNRAITTAADNGAITVWKDDLGSYRGERHTMCQTVASGRWDTLAEVRRWLRRQLPLIRSEEVL